jgi:hypothetical protein
MVGRFEFRVSNDLPWSDSLALYIGQRTARGMAVAQPVTLTELEPGVLSEPAARITNDSAQQLMDELWRCGLRPSEGSGSAGALAATERHLQDLRALTFSALKVKREPR